MSSKFIPQTLRQACRLRSYPVRRSTTALPTFTPALRPVCIPLARSFHALHPRCSNHHSSPDSPQPSPPSQPAEAATAAAAAASEIDAKARMVIGFTCRSCDHRQHKYMSKKAYTTGVVIIKCDGCAVQHLIADHLGWFDSQTPPGTIEDILARLGNERQPVRRGSIASLGKTEDPGLLAGRFEKGDGAVQFRASTLETTVRQAGDEVVVEAKYFKAERVDGADVGMIEYVEK
ncbi:hypothetical protein HDU90_003927 [Geranomyces variabilis]|nr:hypothetical protein HDU90_003927 [Geranomyces variabilis]